jgi:hypothetical protein
MFQLNFNLFEIKFKYPEGKFMSIQATPEVKKTLTVVDRSTKALVTAADSVAK